jgi:hypothetical protein
VNEAERTLPDGEMKTYLSAAMLAYADAAAVWNHKIRHPNLGLYLLDLDNKIVNRYKLTGYAGADKKSL